jgi:hypothetical protein
MDNFRAFAGCYNRRFVIPETDSAHPDETPAVDERK